MIGSISLTKVVLRDMVERKGGHVVVVSSVQGKFGRLNVTHLDYNSCSLYLYVR